LLPARERPVLSVFVFLFFHERNWNKTVLAVRWHFKRNGRPEL
jgi:hypothetical protein